MTTTQNGGKYLAASMIGALGVVYGDIGTSPLYALRECFASGHGVAVAPESVLGILSLILWSLVLIVCVKYLTFVLRADNKGEGGILALLAVVFGDRTAQRRSRAPVILTIGIFGAALLYGDGIITPCITVLGAMEGLEVATPRFAAYIVPLTVLVLVLLFSFQRVGTGGVGRVFGPVMLLWFVTIGVLGVRGILLAPEVLAAVNPWQAIRFLLTHGGLGVIVLGSVFLAVTGAEALYADLGHFGARPIRLAWFVVAFPALTINYFGQGALLLHSPQTVGNPFYGLAPSWALYPMVVLSTAASVIASQALISGAFSLTMQAIHLGYLPRMRILHTSELTRGQIYMPFVNALLMLGCVGLVLSFRSSSRLSAAYGIAVTLTMLITTLLLFLAAQRLWGWKAWTAGLLCLLFAALELVFFGANAVKIGHGGWLPLVIAGGLFAVMTTWKTGRRLLRERLHARLLTFEDFLKIIRQDLPTRVKGTSVYMSGNAAYVPVSLLHNLKHNRVLHERVILLSFAAADEPRVDLARRVNVEPIAEGFYRVVARFGFMETPGIVEVLSECRRQGLALEAGECTYFLSRETVMLSDAPGMAQWRKRLFAFLSRNAQDASVFFGLPPNRVVELGMQIAF
jgi:KUP system potassium uptake protein